MKFIFIAAALFFSIAEIQAQEKPAPDTLAVGGIIFKRVIIETGVSETQWRNRLEKYMVPVIKKARKKLRAGTYTIDVRFLMEKDGSIADVKVLNDLGYGLAEAALNVVLYSPSGPKWNPGEISRNNSRSFRTQLITFQIWK